jgi:hypothetical protein
MLRGIPGRENPERKKWAVRSKENGLANLQIASPKVFCLPSRCEN